MKDGTMRVRVVKATYNSYWYANSIGDVFDVAEVNGCGYKYKVIDENKYFVGEDVEVVDEQPARNKYMREIKSGVWVDVYDVLRAFNVTDPCLQHMLKKCLAAGCRGHKSTREDLQDILATAKRALEMHEEWEEQQ